MVLVVARGDFCVGSVLRGGRWSELRGGHFSEVRNTLVNWRQVVWSL